METEQLDMSGFSAIKMPRERRETVRGSVMDKVDKIRESRAASRREKQEASLNAKRLAPTESVDMGKVEEERATALESMGMAVEPDFKEVKITRSRKGPIKAAVIRTRVSQEGLPNIRKAKNGNDYCSRCKSFVSPYVRHTETECDRIITKKRENRSARRGGPARSLRLTPKRRVFMERMVEVYAEGKHRANALKQLGKWAVRANSRGLLSNSTKKLIKRVMDGGKLTSVQKTATSAARQLRLK